MAKVEETKEIKKVKSKKTVNSSIKKLKLLVTVVDRTKTLFYTDLLEDLKLICKQLFMEQVLLMKHY